MITKRSIGVSPSGKAAGFGPAIRGFESSRPSLVPLISYFEFGILRLGQRVP